LQALRAGPEALAEWKRHPERWPEDWRRHEMDVTLAELLIQMHFAQAAAEAVLELRPELYPPAPGDKGGEVEGFQEVARAVLWNARAAYDALRAAAPASVRRMGHREICREDDEEGEPPVVNG
jgi:hypothetical protein